MNVKGLKEILKNIPEDIEVKMLSCRDDNVTDNFDIQDVVHVQPLRGDLYTHELVFVPN